MADKPKITKEMVAEYIRQNPDSALSYDLLPLAARASNEYLFGAGNRLGANIGAFGALFDSKRDFGKERDFNKQFLQALADYQAQETPNAALAADALGLVGSAVATGAAAPATFGANIGRTTPFATRALRTAKGAGVDQAIRSLLGENGVWEKAQVEGQYLPSGEKAINAIPQALEEIGTSVITAPVAGEVFRMLGKGIQKGAGKTKLDKLSGKVAGYLGSKISDIGGENTKVGRFVKGVGEDIAQLPKYITSESSALRQAGLSPDDVEAGRLVSGTANIPSLPENYSKAVGEALVSGKDVAESNLAKAKASGVRMTPLEAYAPKSNVLRDLKQKALISPEYGLKYGELIQDRPQIMAERASQLRSQLQKAKDKLYGAAIGKDTSGYGMSPRSTIGQLNEQKIAAYTQGDISEGDRLKQLLRSYPEGAKAEQLYGAAEDLSAVQRAGGGNRYAPTTPVTRPVNPDVALKEASDLLDVSQILRSKSQRPAINIASQAVGGTDPKLYARTPSRWTRGSLDILSPLVDKFRTTEPEYFNKISDLLLGGDLTKIASKAQQIAPVFQSKALSPMLGRATGSMATDVINSGDKPVMPEQIKPIKKQITDEEIRRDIIGVTKKSHVFNPETGRYDLRR